MAEITRTSVENKLALGLERLNKAADDPDGLGLALTTVHGALEDHLRLWLSTHQGVPREVRAAVLDRRAFSWRELLSHLDEYGEFERSLQELRAQIPRFNGMRQEVAHGGTYEGSRAELVRYAELVRHALEQGIGARVGAAPSRSASDGSRRLYDPVALERLREQKLARLDREWKMQRQEYSVLDQKGRRRMPSKWLSIGQALFALGFGVLWWTFAQGFSAGRHGPPDFFGYVGPAFAVCIAGYSLYCYNKAVALERAEDRYRQRRAELLSAEDPR